MGRPVSKYQREFERQYARLEKYLTRLAPYLGRLVIAFNSLEDSLDTAILQFFGDIPERGYAVISGMSFGSKIELFGRLYGPLFSSINDPLWNDELKLIIKDLKESNSKRNDIIHAAWFDYDPNTKKVKAKIRIHNDKVEELEKQIQPKDILGAIRLIEKLDDRIYTLFDENWGSWW